MRRRKTRIKLLFGLIVTSLVYVFVLEENIEPNVESPYAVNIVHEKLSLDIAYNHSKDRSGYPLPILLFTYTRSGSTFLADVIQSNPEVFYVMEPLHVVQNNLHQKSPVILTNLHGQRSVQSSKEVAKRLIRHLLNCQLTLMPRGFFMETQFFDVSRKISIFNECMKYDTRLKCGKLLESECQKSKFLVIKTVRMQANHLIDIKNEFPNLKVIYLHRDPRAVLRSQKFYSLFKNIPESNYIRNYCENANWDTQMFRVLKQFYPQDIIILYYEIFGTDPITVSKKLYRTLNIPFTSTSKERIRNLTELSQKCTRDISICTSKFKTATTVSMWRSEIEYLFVQKVDRLCQELYRLHGYVNLTDPNVLPNMSHASQNMNLSILPHLH